MPFEARAHLRQAIAQARELGKLIAVGDHRARPAVAQPELERLLAEEREERHGDQPCLVSGHVRERRLVPLRQQDRDPVAALQAVRDQEVGEPIREPRDVGEGELARLAGGIELDQRQRGAVPIGDVRADVEPRRNAPRERHRRRTLAQPPRRDHYPLLDIRYANFLSCGFGTR